jgi:D-alanyl-D-alanine carboxypeptidase/D-alanyl-D-alanine-endopeptidase (penicillin-binding protein 4)
LSTIFGLAVAILLHSMPAVKRLLLRSLATAKTTLSAACLVLLSAPCAPAQESKPPATLAELRRRLNELVSQPKYDSALWGVKIVSLDSGKTLFEHNAQKLFSPASNSKLYTVAMALDRLGEDYTIKTTLFSQTKPNHRGTLKGDLFVYGRGDPTINARLHGSNIFNAFEPLVAALTNAGVRRIRGDLVGDESFFRGPAFGSGWAWDDLEFYYGAEISALTINDNTLQVSVKPGEELGKPCRLSLSAATALLSFSNRTETVAAGRRRTISFYRPLGQNVVYVSGEIPLDDPGYREDVTMHNPAAFFVSWFKDALAQRGIKLKGKLRTLSWQDRQMFPIDYTRMVELGAMESPPLRVLAREVEKPSQNLYTDLLLAQVGETTRLADTRPGTTSESLGIRELNKFLIEAAVKSGDVLFEEGSGLSRNNLTTPNATVALLQYMSRHKSARAYLEALPIAGVDGTLRNRMKDTPAAGNVRAKTGTLRWANSLSGYLATAAGEHLAFSLMLNRYHSSGPGASARNDLDTIAVLLAGFTGRSTEDSNG